MKLKHNIIFILILVLVSSFAFSSSITFVNKIPNDINSLNGFNVLFNYTIGDNLTIPKFSYKVNDTFGVGVSYVNGSMYMSNFNNITMDCDLTNNICNATIYDNQIYPFMANTNPDNYRNNPAIVINETLSNVAYFSKQYNLKNNTSYNFVEVSVNGTTASSISVYIANSSYTTGDFTSNPNVCLIGTQNANSPYNHCHVGNYTICDRVFYFSINNGTICGNIKVTENSTIIVKSASTGTTSYRFLNGLIRTGETGRTNNNGVTWTNDATKSLMTHLHQYNNDTRLNYYADNDGTSTPISIDQYEITYELQGSSIIQPYSQLYDTNIGYMLIDYTNAYNPLGYAITNYNISLYYDNLTFAQHIINNDLDNMYVWNFASVSSNNYVVGVTAKSSDGLSTTTFSDTFLIANDTSPKVNPYNAYTLHETNTSYDRLIFNYTTKFSDKVIFNFYENNKIMTIANINFEPSFNNSRKDYSDEFVNFSCGTACPKWNMTGGYDGRGAYQWNATAGQSLYTNMTLNQINLSTYTMSAWVMPNAYNFKNPFNDFTRLIIAGVNSVSYYQLASQTSTKMLYCRNQYDSTHADQVEYHINGNWTPYVWVHVTCVLTPTTSEIYIDGVLVNSTTRLYPNLKVTVQPTGNQLVIGNILAFGGTRVLNGTMDDIRIFNRNLNAQQILNIYNNVAILEPNNTINNMEYKSSVYAMNDTGISDETYSSNSVLMKTYYKTQVNLVYPTNTYHYMDYNGQVIFDVNASTNSNCVINDTRFTKLNNTHYYNATINQTEQKIYLSLNCSDYFDSTTNSFMFAIDNTIPFINILTPTLDPSYTTNKYNFNFTFYAYDKFLDMMNFTASNGSIYYYVDEVLTSYNNITKTQIVNLTEGYNNLEICIRDSLQNSPKIKDKMINFDITSNLIIDSIADTKKNVKNNYEFDKENTHLFFMDGVQILRTISSYDKKGKLKSNSISNFTNEWDLSEEHIKTNWDLKKDKQDDYMIMRYECLNTCDKMLVLTDRGRTRIVDDTKKMYFTFDDVVKMGYGVQYYTEEKVAYVKIYYKDTTQFNKAKSVERIDPITGGLMNNCMNKTIIVDSFLPAIVFNPNTFANNYYIDGFDVHIDLSVTDNNFNSTTIYLYNETHNLIDTYTGFSQNIIITFTNLTYGVYYFNATTIDLAGNINSSETRKVTLLGDMDTFALDKYCVDNSLTNTVINAPYCDTNTNCYFDVYYSNVSDYNDLSMIYTFDTTEYYLRNGLTSNSIGVNTPNEENVTLKLKTMWFNSTTMKCSPYYTNRMKIMTPYYVDVYLYRTNWMNKTVKYDGSFNYLYALYTNKVDGLLIPTSTETLSSVNTINALLKQFNKKQLGITMQQKAIVDNRVYFWDRYSNGKATLKLYEKGGHEIYLINSNVYMNNSYPQFSKPINYNTLNFDSLLIKGINLNESTDLGIIVGVEDTNPLELWSKIIKTIFIILLFLIIHGIVFFITARVGIPQISMFLAFITVPITLALIIITWVF